MTITRSKFSLVKIISNYLFALGPAFSGSIVLAQEANIACPALPLSNLNSVTYDPNSPNDIIADFHVVINPSGYNSGNSTDQKLRSISIYKESMGNESEGLQYEFLQTSGGNLTNKSNSQNFNDLAHLGIIGRSGPFDGINAEAEIPLNIEGIANFRIKIPKGQFSQTSKSIQYDIVGNWSELNGNSNCPFENGTTQSGFKSFYLNVPISMSINLAGNISAGQINFGSITQMKSLPKKSVSLNINSNSPYKISIDSDNNGSMKNMTPGLEGDEINYSVALDGAEISKLAPYSTNSPTNGTISKSLEISITDHKDARAGIYKDTIYLTISPN